LSDAWRFFGLRVVDLERVLIAGVESSIVSCGTRNKLACSVVLYEMRKRTACINARLALAPVLLAACLSARAQAPTPLNVEACKACHGPAGVSLNPTIPNLAGQKPAYLESQLKAFHSKERKNDLMNAIAAQLTDADMHALAAFWSRLPAIPSDANGKASVSAAIRSRMEFPEHFPAGFTVYQTVTEDGVMTKRYANVAAWESARAGRKLPNGSVLLQVSYQVQTDATGEEIAGPVQSYAGMELRNNWGNDIPLLLRNENWDYALFAADGKRRDELNEAQCLACHKPKETDNFVFTMKQLREAATHSHGSV
jgi:cytochrome c553